jgi:hypothetical protein
MRRSLPALAGVGVFVAVAVLIAILLAALRDEEAAIRQATEAWVTAQYLKGGHKEGIDFRIAEVAVGGLVERTALARAKVERRDRPAGVVVYARLERADSGWAVAGDLFEDFAAFAKNSDLAGALARNCAIKVMHEFQREVSYPAGLPYSYVLADEPKCAVCGGVGPMPEHISHTGPAHEAKPDFDVVAQVDAKFELGSVTRMYVELYRYKGGAWARGGEGRIFERPGAHSK